MSFLDIRILKSGSLGKPVIIIIGRKVVKKAVQRNLLKRRIKAILQPIAKEKDKNYLVKIRLEAVKASFGELKTDILERLRISSK